VAVMLGGRLGIVLRLMISDERVTEIEAIADPAHLGALEVTILGD